MQKAVRDGGNQSTTSSSSSSCNTRSSSSSCNTSFLLREPQEGGREGGREEDREGGREGEREGGGVRRMLREQECEEDGGSVCLTGRGERKEGEGKREGGEEEEKREEREERGGGGSHALGGVQDDIHATILRELKEEEEWGEMKKQGGGGAFSLAHAENEKNEDIFLFSSEEAMPPEGEDGLDLEIHRSDMYSHDGKVTCASEQDVCALLRAMRADVESVWLQERGCVALLQLLEDTRTAQAVAHAGGIATLLHSIRTYSLSLSLSLSLSIHIFVYI
jgi:hypothetical protein